MQTQKNKILITALAAGLTFSTYAGTADAKKSVKAPVTTETFIVELVGELGIDLQGSTDLFQGVSGDAAAYFEAAVRTGILTEEDVAEVNAGNKISREQAYTYLVRSLNLKDTYSDDSFKNFKDYRSISDEAEPYVAAAAELGLIDKSDKTFKPNKPLTSEDIDEMFDLMDENITVMPIVHTNDMHGRITFDEDEGHMGLAKVSTLVNEVRAENPDAMLFDLGDTLHGTALVNNFDGVPALEALTEMSYDAMVPGNHDFNFGHEYLEEVAGNAAFPIVSANILEDGENFLDDYTVIERGGQTFGVVGVTATDTAEKTSPKNIEGIEFQDEVSRTQDIVDEIEDEVDHIILLSHSGLDTDINIANEVEGVDLIIGGHSHDTIETPVKYEHAYVTQAYEYTKAAGHTNLLFSGDELIGVNGFLYRDSADKVEDPQIADIFAPYQDILDELLNEVVGSTPVALDGARENVRTQETNLGNLITDAMRSTLGTDIAITNGGGIRASIDAGEVTRGEVEEVLPFINTLVQMNVTGEQLLAALEHSVRMAPEQNGGFLHISGFSFKYDASAPAGSRVTEVLVGGEPLDTEKVYTVATNDFTAAGGDGYTMFSADDVVFDSGELLSAVLTEALASGQPIPGVEGRIVSE
ncbi:5'-nucleotidase C-terminal domain-containing protein [Jeotgalibacillus haloalkalitolerans]|uniref:5'-nucleotidase C-terminal domain-containing protein n=1 Tax=Jeotgalibacillus haloalkalitolerans TaxID=3104292 RepID=A0ABU5KJJ0_9BACL|nr:5'-nucleotidase C-terminal domain-containing protein [Jeotgalibacillus sp. HH7-29]MDZ5711411.1 5'-nucleotidase C-terminal domain-containing protein [Jeotgalibacillus sp. HH7-29]